MKKLVLTISSLVIIFALFLFFYFRPHNYDLEYTVNDVKVKEIYNNDKKYYQFILNYNDMKYSIISKDKYSNKRNLITDIKVSEEDEITCLRPESNIVSLYSVCSKDRELISFNYNDNIVKEKQDEYENIKIYDLETKKYLIWNYKDFILLSNDKKDKIKLFDKDVYNINLVTTYNNYLIIPDYNSSYSFDKLYLIDVNKNKTNEIKLRYSVYFDSYFLGSKKNLIYLYDKKEEQEYYINIKKEKIYKTSNKVLVNNEWEKVSSYKLKEEKVSFTEDNVYNYKVINNKLYSYILDEEYLTKVSDMDIKTVVKTNGYDVYFICDNTLYKYNPYDGIKALLSNSEWDFNYTNMVFIFD